MQEPREKKHRLDPSLYKGEVRASFAANLIRRPQYFLTLERFKEHERHFLRALDNHDCKSELYLFMPDHFHAIVTGTNDYSNIREAMSKFKQYSGFSLSQSHADVRWQKDFFDHIHRNERDLQEQMYYILCNPIRRGIVDHWKEYPFKGSTVFDLTKWE